MFDGSADLRIGEIGVGMALHVDEGPRGLATGHGVFVRPDLRNDLTR